MRIRPRGEQPEGAGVAGHSCEDAAGLLMLGLATMLVVLFMTAVSAWAQEATSTPSPEGAPGLPEKTGGETADVQRDRYDEELGEWTVAEITKTQVPASEGSILSSPEGESGSGVAAEPTAGLAAELPAGHVPELPTRQTPKGPTPVLPETGGADLVPLFLGVTCLVVGVLALLLGCGGGCPGACPAGRLSEGR